MELKRRPVAPPGMDVELTGHPHGLKSLIAEAAWLEPSRSLDGTDGLTHRRFLAWPGVKSREEEELHGFERPKASAVGTRRVQRHGRANERLQGCCVDLLTLVEVDGTPGIALEARIEEARRVRESGSPGKGHLHDVL